MHNYTNIHTYIHGNHEVLHKLKRMANITNQSFCDAVYGDLPVDVSTVTVYLAISVIWVFLFGNVLFSLRIKTWNSAAKRFTIALTVSHLITFMSFAALELSLGSASGNLVGWHAMDFLIRHSFLDTYTGLYFIAAPVALMLQIGAPMLSEDWKRRLTPNIQHIVEGLVHGVTFTISVLIFIFVFIIDGATTFSEFLRSGCIPSQYTSFNFVVDAHYAVLVLSLFIVLSTILVVVCLCRKFRSAHTITRMSKWMIIRLIILFFTSGVIAGVPFVLGQLRLPYTLEYNIIYNLVSFVAYNAYFLSLLTLIYPPNTWFCKCVKRSRAPHHVPLLPNTERQQTNPESEWDHVNDNRPILSQSGIT